MHIKSGAQGRRIFMAAAAQISTLPDKRKLSLQLACDELAAGERAVSSNAFCF